MSGKGDRLELVDLQITAQKFALHPAEGRRSGLKGNVTPTVHDGE